MKPQSPYHRGSLLLGSQRALNSKQSYEFNRRFLLSFQLLICACWLTDTEIMSRKYFVWNLFGSGPPLLFSALMLRDQRRNNMTWRDSVSHVHSNTTQDNALIWWYSWTLLRNYHTPSGCSLIIKIHQSIKILVTSRTKFHFSSDTDSFSCWTTSSMV